MSSLSEITTRVITGVWQGFLPSSQEKPCTNQSQKVGVSVAGWLVEALWIS